MDPPLSPPLNFPVDPPVDPPLDPPPTVEPRHSVALLCEVPLGQAPCGSVVYGKVDEMSPAAPGLDPPPGTPPPPMTCGRQGGQGRIDDITDAARDFALLLP